MNSMVQGISRKVGNHSADQETAPLPIQLEGSLLLSEEPVSGLCEPVESNT
jgi:hypothetical protein